MFAIFDKANPDTINIRGLNLATVKHMTVEVIRLPLLPELLKIGHDLLFSAWTDRVLVHIVYTYALCPTMYYICTL
jgi:hypothetical protein